MLRIKSDINGFENFDKIMSVLGKTEKTFKLDSNLMSFLKSKVNITLNEIMNEKLGGTTNDEDIETYKSRNKFVDTEDGFILVNDSMILPGKNGHNYYPFSLALAFEYGTGIVGSNNPKNGHWSYNIKNHTQEWTYTRNGKTYTTKGYEGKEIYRTLTERVNSQMNNWIEEFMNR